VLIRPQDLRRGPFAQLVLLLYYATAQTKYAPMNIIHTFSQFENVFGCITVHLHKIIIFRLSNLRNNNLNDAKLCKKLLTIVNKTQKNSRSRL